MTNTTLLLRCAHCGVTNLYSLEAVEHDRGEWLIRCPICDAHNVLALHLGTNPPLEVAGWRE